MTGPRAKIYRDIPRIDAEVIASLRDLGVADLHDALSPAERSAGLLNSSIRPIVPGVRVCGQAVTAFCAPGDSLMAHCALYLARPGDVLVISNGGVPHGALWGGYVAFDAKTFGIAGTIVDAPVRDTAFIRELGYPVWASSVSVSRAGKTGEGYVNLPVSCGGSLINPGDIIVADDDGVLAFSPQHVQAMVNAVRSRAQMESELRRRMQAGERLFETQKFGALLESQGIAIEEGHWRGPAVPKA